VNIELKTGNLNVADKLVRFFLDNCDKDQIDLIKGINVSKTISEISMDAKTYTELKNEGCDDNSPQWEC